MVSKICCNVTITNSETIPHLQALFTNGSHRNESREGIPMSSGVDASQKLSCNSSAQYALHVSGDNEKKQSIRRCTALFIRRKAGGPANEIREPPPWGRQQQEQTEPVKGTVYYIKAIITNYELPVVLAVAVMVITMPITLRALIQMVKKRSSMFDISNLSSLFPLLSSSGVLSVRVKVATQCSCTGSTILYFWLLR